MMNQTSTWLSDHDLGLVEDLAVRFDLNKSETLREIIMFTIDAYPEELNNHLELVRKNEIRKR